MSETSHNNLDEPVEKTGVGSGVEERLPPERSILRRHPFRVIACAILVAIFAVAGLRFWQYLQSYVSTSDAEIEANIAPISSRIEGTVTHVYVHNTETVKAGELLVTLDPRDYRVAVEKARADLAQAKAQAQSAKSDYTAALATFNEAEANDVKARSDARRYAALLEASATSREQYDEALRVARVADATVQAGSASAAAARKMVTVRQAATLAAKAALDQALLHLSYTEIRAPVAGVVGNRAVQVGERVEPGQGLLAVTEFNNLWVTANFKETSIGEIRTGSRATIHVDALGRSFKGYVVGLGGATGSLYSLLPPENATGNWIKVVQRLPVRLRFDKGQDPVSDLRPGLSVEVKVWRN
jgi:membrane fusion protein (multidrug efflux system)